MCALSTLSVYKESFISAHAPVSQAGKSGRSLSPAPNNGSLPAVPAMSAVPAMPCCSITASGLASDADLRQLCGQPDLLRKMFR